MKRRKRVTRAFVHIASLVMAVLCAHLWQPGPQGQSPTPEDDVAELIKRYRCWSGPAPSDMQGRLPGHVVATVDGVVRYSNELVAPALDLVFAHQEAPASEAGRRLDEVHAFCR